jgi:hypothetical protein
MAQSSRSHAHALAREKVWGWGCASVIARDDTGGAAGVGRIYFCAAQTIGFVGVARVEGVD